MSNSLDPDQVQHFVGPEVGSNCLQRLSADKEGKELKDANNLGFCLKFQPSSSQKVKVLHQQ